MGLHRPARLKFALAGVGLLLPVYRCQGLRQRLR